MCNSKRQKRSAKKVGKKGRQKRAAKGGNVKEDDSALALQYMSFYSMEPAHSNR